jgi:hypothetical protein
MSDTLVLAFAKTRATEDGVCARRKQRRNPISVEQRAEAQLALRWRDLILALQSRQHPADHRRRERMGEMEALPGTAAHLAKLLHLFAFSMPSATIDLPSDVPSMTIERRTAASLCRAACRGRSRGRSSGCSPQRRKVPQRRITGPEVVEAEAHTVAPQLLERRQRGLESLHQDVLGQLKRQVAWLQLRLGKRGCHARDEAGVGEIVARDVHVDLELGEGVVAKLPFAHLPARVRSMKSGERNDQPRLLGDRDE